VICRANVHSVNITGTLRTQNGISTSMTRSSSAPNIAAANAQGRYELSELRKSRSEECSGGQLFRLTPVIRLRVAMTEYTDRHDALREKVVATQQALAGLSPEQRESGGDELERLEEVLGFAATVLDQVDPELVRDSTHNTLSQTFESVAVNASSPTLNERAVADQLLAALAEIPGDPREIEASKVKESAANFQRSAQQRLNALEEQIESAHASANEVATDLETRRQQIIALIEETKAALDVQTNTRWEEIEASVTSLEGTAQNHVQRLDALVTDQQEAFRKAQDERAEEHRENEKSFEAQMEKLTAEAQARTGNLISEIEEMKERSAELVGTIGVTGTASRYGEEADEQRGTADHWRFGTVLLGVLAVAAAIAAAFDHKAATIGAKIGIAILLGGVATYTARQSARHRRREEHAKQLQLDLAAFPVFIGALPEEARDEETIRMVRRSFRGASSHISDEDEPGLGSFSQFLQRRKRAKEADGDE
jgi:hypothetical protein